MRRSLQIVVLCLGYAGAVFARAGEAEPFSTDLREPNGPWIRPAATIDLVPEYSGQWLVAGDLDSDGEVEFVSARNDNQAVMALSAYDRQGRMLWHWGEPGAGSPILTYDVPVQIYDLDGDGSNEVWLSVEDFLLALDGVTGEERRRVALPEGLRTADCIVFADLRGSGRAGDAVIKDRYNTIWAFTGDFDLLWKATDPGGFRTCHQPVVFDIDGDGRDEVMAGYALLDDGGKELWTVRSDAVELDRGHLDCARIVRRGEKPEGWRLALTYCGAGAVALVDGTGRTLWEKTGRHFESIDVADIDSASPGPEIVVDIDHQPYGQSPTWLLSEDGRLLGTWLTNYSRHHALVDWNGDGRMEVVFGHARAVCDGHGKRLATLAHEGAEAKPAGAGDPEPFVFVGDVTDDGREDVVLWTAERIEVYSNPSTAAAGRSVRVGTGRNFTLY